ncbi:AraC family transcriptional regulator [Pseudoalteromonas sp. BDTF-M6]|uniref:GlxA family transcriptional regulator n=1 Tax=Pseudoalteromonas sp. BDTF-M6 TaxID=2796132 RepID=UPI002015E58E|nr:AraC family transcriptional regulator [Pseudoalteromonas sp. BDTF-M6]
MKPFNVLIALYPQMLATSLTLPFEMLHAGYAFARRHNKEAPKLCLQLMAQTTEPVLAHSGLPFTANVGLDALDRCDLLILPSLWRNPRPVLRKQERMIQALSKLDPKRCAMIGVGTGNCFLAEAKLLDGHPATTHWHYADQFKRDYPKVELKPEYFITQAEGLYCVASLNALADVIVHILENLYGRECALHVQRNFSHEVRKPYEQQRYLEGMNERHPDELIAQVQFWLKNNLSAELSIAEIASQFAISQRTLTRRFKQATGLSPNQYWRKLKVQAGQELLANSNLSINDIALELGFNHQALLNKLFAQELGQSPSEYRTLVRKKLFSSDSD